MKKRNVAAVLTVILMWMTLFSISGFAAGEVIIQDDALERFIRREIGKPTGPINAKDVEGITILDATT